MSSEDSDQRRMLSTADLKVGVGRTARRIRAACSLGSFSETMQSSLNPKPETATVDVKLERREFVSSSSTRAPNSRAASRPSATCLHRRDHLPSSKPMLRLIGCRGFLIGFRGKGLGS